MVKKMLISICFFLLLFLLPIDLFAFVDVPQYHDYYEDIQSLYHRGVVQGYADFSFHPNYYVPRAEALGMIFKASGENFNEYQRSGFSDVYEHEWFFPVINYAWTRGMIKGHPDGSFRPRETVNTAEGVKMVIEVFFPDYFPPSYTNDPLLEISSGDWFSGYMLFAKQKGIINKNKYYHPAKNLTRGELASMIYRALMIREGNNKQIDALDQKYSDEYRLFIPKLNIIDVPIHHVPDFTDYNKALDVLWEGVGNFRYQPGVLGKIVIYGHSSYYRNANFPYKYVFRHIDKLEVGDRIYMNYKNKGYVYEIFQKRIVAPNNLEILQSYGREEVSLFTCWPPYSIQKRYVVDATRIGGDE